MEKKITICIGTDEAKNIRVRLSLLLVENDRVAFRHFHSYSVSPGDDLAAARARIEAHIANPDGGVPGAPWPSIPDEEWADVEAHVAITHKPAVVAAFQAKQAEALALDQG